MLQTLATTLIAALSLGQVSTLTWINPDRYSVRPLSTSSFEVFWRGRSTPRDFWCVAGDYARRELGATPATHIYRVSSLARHIGQVTRFSLSPDGALPTGLAVIDSPRSLRVSQAQSLCGY